MCKKCTGVHESCNKDVDCVYMYTCVMVTDVCLLQMCVLSFYMHIPFAAVFKTFRPLQLDGCVCVGGGGFACQCWSQERREGRRES